MKMHNIEPPFFSIIVPIYNSESYLDECLESICAQTFTSFEVLLINDGSSDNSLSICRKWKEKDPRIIVFDQKNQGASAARNRGLKNAKGKYVQLVDSDDTISQKCLEIIYNNILRDNYPDIVEFCLELHSCPGKTFRLGTIIKSGYYDTEFIHKVFLPAHLFVEKNTDIYYNIFNVLRVVKRDVILEHSIMFNEKIRRWEDWLFAMQIFHCSSDMTVINDVLYQYRGHENGGLGGRYDRDTYKYVVESYKQMDIYFGDKYNLMSQYSLSKKLENFDRCAKEIFDNEKKNLRKTLIIELLKDDYVSRVICESQNRSGFGIIRKAIVRQREDIAYYILFVLYSLRNTRWLIRKSLMR